MFQKVSNNANIYKRVALVICLLFYSNSLISISCAEDVPHRSAVVTSPHEEPFALRAVMMDLLKAGDSKGDQTDAAEKPETHRSSIHTGGSPMSCAFVSVCVCLRASPTC